jgi:chitinase
LLVHGDNDIEPNEWLTLRLANPSGAVLEADPRGFGYIYNDDLVRLSIGDASVIEGNSGSKTMTFVASLTAPSPDPVTFSMYTGSANGTANQNGDTDFVPETAANNPMQIPAGQLAATFAVTVNGDTKDEGNEVFSVNTTQPVGAVLLDPQGIGTILNDDSATLSISDATPVVEGNSGTKVANFTVTLSAAVDHDVTFSLATQANTASNPADYTPVAPTPFTIPQGQTSLTFPVTIKGDTTVESTETFFVNLTAASGATVRDGQGVGTINTDEWPSLSISNASVAEGDSGTTTMSFTVTLSQAVNAPVTYNLTSANGTAVAGSDFVGVPTIAQTLPAGQTVRAFLVTINGDTAAEAGEQFTLTLGVNPGAGATVAYGTGTGTILNDD